MMNMNDDDSDGFGSGVLGFGFDSIEHGMQRSALRHGNKILSREYYRYAHIWSFGYSTLPY